jgi:acyl-CoA thioesterase FadM
VQLTIENIGTTSITERYDVKRDGDTLAVGGVRHVFVDLSQGAKRPMPDEVKGALEPYTS